MCAELVAVLTHWFVNCCILNTHGRNVTWAIISRDRFPWW